MDKVIGEVINAYQHCEAGIVYEIKCPKCKEIIKDAEYGWWDKKCSCGLFWHVKIKAIGE